MPLRGKRHSLRLLMLGSPGAGKGTQGTRLAAKYGVPHLASGDLLRKIIALGEDTEMARAARLIQSGKMVSDDTANALMLGELQKPDAAHGFILDGYPRTLSQAHTLTAFLTERGTRLDAVVALEISHAAVIERLGNRITCPNCGETYHAVVSPPKVPGICDVCGFAGLSVREDDLPERIAVRLKLYAERTEPLLGFYRDAGILTPVNAEGTEEAVFGRIAAALGN